MRLHRHGRLRRWIGRRLGGDEATGDRVYRRLLHALGAAVLLYDVLPAGTFGPVPKEAVLLLALAAVLLLELLRHVAGLELPTIRPYESGRPASFSLFALGLVAAVLLFPFAIAVAVVLGAALVDPLCGELRSIGVRPVLRWVLPFGAYALLAVVALREVGAWTWGSALVGALLAAGVGVGSEGLRVRGWDDDLAMPILPGIALVLLGLVLPGA